MYRTLQYSTVQYKDTVHNSTRIFIIHIQGIHGSKVIIDLVLHKYIRSKMWIHIRTNPILLFQPRGADFLEEDADCDEPVMLMKK